MQLAASWFEFKFKILNIYPEAQLLNIKSHRNTLEKDKN